MMHLRLRARFSGIAISAFCTLAGSLAAQREVWIVDQALGPGAHFADLPAAVAAASSGDILRVRVGTYTGFSTGKSLSLLADTGVHGPVIQAAPGVTTHGVQIAGLPAGERFDLIGFDVRPPAASGVACDVSSCAGDVELEWCEFAMREGVLVANSRAGLQVRNSSRVVVSRSALIGAPALLAESSRVEVVGSTLTGNDGGLFGPSPGSIAADGVVGRNSQLELSGCTLRGGSVPFIPMGFDAASGFSSENSTWTLRTDGNGLAIAGTVEATAVPAARGTGVIHADPRFGFIPAGGGAQVTVGLQLLREPLPGLRLIYFPSWSHLEASLHGRAGDLYLLLFGLPMDPLPLPGLGDLRLDPALGPFVMAGGTIGSSGYGSLELTTSTDPLLLGARLGWQGLRSTETGFAFSNLATYVHR